MNEFKCRRHNKVIKRYQYLEENDKKSFYVEVKRDECCEMDIYVGKKVAKIQEGANCTKTF